MQSAADRTFDTSAVAAAMEYMAASMGKPLLYGPNDKPLRPSAPEYGIRRSAAARSGSMKNWVPKRLTSRQQETLERIEIVNRATDLTNNDPHAAGVVETIAMSVIGAGLVPRFSVDAEALGIDKDTARLLQNQMHRNIMLWWAHADAGQRMNFGQIQFLKKRNLFQFGEYLILLHMIDDPLRPFSLACQVIHPLRLKTPIDKINDPRIRDGVELGDYGEPVAYWIKKAANGRLMLADHSKNFLRISARHGHRIKVLHGFIQREPEQVRGVPEFAPGMKMFRDLADYLDAELVSNIVTAAFAMFIEVAGNDPFNVASNLSSLSESRLDANGKTKVHRYQELTPGAIMYGNQGEKPHPIAASRPGQTFEPFTKTVKKALSMACGGIPYPVLFKDVDGVNFAGFRSAMLEAWRVFMTHRTWEGETFCQPINLMLQEEAWLRGRLDIDDFYTNRWELTRAEWIGPPKGDIEPVKAAQADLLLTKGNLKTHDQAVVERGGRDFRSVADKLEEEYGIIVENKLPDPRQDKKSAVAPDNDDDPDKETTKDDE